MRLALLALLSAAGVARPADARIDFGRDVRPVLADLCFTCHGPDPKARKGELRLDLRDAALKGGGSGEPAFNLEDAAKSPAVLRMRSHDAAEVMPPPKSAKKPTPAQIDLVERWVKQGAGYTTHWGFTAPVRPPVPAVKDSSWVRNPIDAFVLARLDREGFAPSPPAVKVTLIRRLSLDLIGLPPTPAEVDAFVADQSPNATAKLIDRLLASPHYGEKWGRQWLDAARYADSDGFEKDKPRSVWAYRDWVIGALNRDLPYDKFVTEQLAGDLLPNATQDQIVATGFLRNSMINEEGGVDPEQFRMEAMFDRMDAIGKGVLGLTLQCAQCHTHKYDPITHEDYYKVFAYLNDTHEASVPTYAPADMARRSEIVRRVKELEAELKHRRPDWAAGMAAWEREALARTPNWAALPIENAGDNSQRYVTHPDKSLTAWGYAPTKWTSTFTAKLQQSAPVTALRLDMLTDPDLPLGGPGRAPTGLFALSEFRADVAPASDPNKKTRVKFVRARADFGDAVRPLDRQYDDRSNKPRVTGPVELAIDGDDQTAWGADAGPGRRNADRAAVFVPAAPIDASVGVVFTFYFRQNHGGWNSDDNQTNNLGRFKVSTCSGAVAEADPLPENVLAALRTPADKRTPAQADLLFSRYRLTVAEWQGANAEVAELWASHPEPTAQLSVASRMDARPTFMLDRGDFLKPTKKVSAGVPAFLNPMPADAPANRLGLAQWLTAKNAPTTARSLVNRVWQSYFGTGLVASSEDLGTQAEPPSHPELLDWLAVEFVESGWSQKHLHRLIASSNTYQQASKMSPELRRRDPGNRLLARGPRFRVEGEAVRDIALAASGLLSEKVGGPPCYPPAPAFLFEPPVSYGPKVWPESKGEDRYRRAVYTFRFRSVPYPVLASFDAPNADASCVRRPRSNTPMQALTTLNETVFMECARALAQKALREAGPDDAARAAFVFRRCTGRDPGPREGESLLGFVKAQHQKFAALDARPWELAADDPAHPPKLAEGVTPAQLAAWTALARLALNLDETITKE